MMRCSRENPPVAVSCNCQCRVYSREHASFGISLEQNDPFGLNGVGSKGKGKYYGNSRYLHRDY